MPDKWEYPWFAAWDLAFHAVSLGFIDPEFAQEQLGLMLRGPLPAPERLSCPPTSGTSTT